MPLRLPQHQRAARACSSETCISHQQMMETRMTTAMTQQLAVAAAASKSKGLWILLCARQLLLLLRQQSRKWVAHSGCTCLGTWRWYWGWCWCKVSSKGPGPLRGSLAYQSAVDITDSACTRHRSVLLMLRAAASSAMGAVCGRLDMWHSMPWFSEPLGMVTLVRASILLRLLGLDLRSGLSGLCMRSTALWATS